MRKIIIDTDIGVDDAFAIAYAAKHFDLLGLTTIFGNVQVGQAVKNAKFFSQKMHIDVPIFRGCSRPLALPPDHPNVAVHGADGLGDAYDNPCDDHAGDAIRFIIDTVKAFPGEVTLVAIGPLTNLATAINLAPEIIPLVNGVVIMGGAFGTDGNSGNVTPHCEFNIWKDPHAADQVLTANWSVTLLPLDVTHKVLLLGDEVRQINQQVLSDISRNYMNYSLKREGFEGMALHDTLTISWLINPQWYTTVESPVRVVTEGITRGQTLYRQTHLGSRFNPFDGLKAQRLCIGVDSEAVKAHFIQSMSA
ncbi:nucleoside hydrolase [Rouxiella sp. Mn2063]|uniref:nucleoside hydrolase n=1 Tax=Rouxiella sp. Mn2063 TaxID=3395262 RepID=UPI003BBDC84B